MSSLLQVETDCGDKKEQSEYFSSTLTTSLTHTSQKLDMSQSKASSRTKSRKHKVNKRSTLELSNVEVDQDSTLNLPPRYKGSEMFMPSGERVYWLAEVLPPPLGPVTCQDFDEIRSRCLSQGELFEDPEFPAVDNSVFSNEYPFEVPVTWLRPGDLVENPKLYVKEYSRFDVKQGYLGDCWIHAALATLTLHQKLFWQVVPPDQGFGEQYVGVFHFRFWQYGRWVDVVIDDRLPTFKGDLIFLRSSENNEFWGALLEKAYAKLYGSYEALERGFPSEAMEDFSGCLTEIHKVADLPITFFCNLLKAYERNSLITASISKGNNDISKRECGLSTGHAYSITCVKYLDCKTLLLRIRNPWGDDVEWTGAWSDKSPEWSRVPQETKKSLALTFDNDGEFWMSFKDFTKYFSYVYICNLSPDSLYSEDYLNVCNKTWEMFMFEGEWVKGETAGGCYVHSESFRRNPQYQITLTEPDEEDENTCTVIITLMQKYNRSRFRLKFLNINLKVYRADDEEREELDAQFFKDQEPIAYTRPHMRSRGFTARFRLELGHYVIVPCTTRADEEGEFFLRVLAAKRS